mgnify:CR=1 FL=1
MPYFCGWRPCVEAELGHQLLGQRAARALGDDGVLALELHAAREAVGRLAVLADAHVAGGDAGDRALVVVEHLGGGEARIDLDAQLGRLLAQPAAEVAEADDVVAVVAHQRRHDEIGDAQDAGGAQSSRSGPRSPAVSTGAPLAFQSGISAVEADGVDDGARQDVRPDLGALLQHDHARARGRPRRRAASAGSRRRGRPGPAPTITTSKSIASRGGRSAACAIGQAPR